MNAAGRLARRAPTPETFVPGVFVRAIAAVLACGAFGACPVSRAESMSGALARAYVANPDLNQQRAALRATDENAPKTRAGLVSGQATVSAAEIALKGVRGEAAVGQRTTFDILTAQKNLLNARITLVVAQRDRVVASYAALAATGWLTAERLDLGVALYDPTAHFDQVKRAMIGVRTPDGR